MTKEEKEILTRALTQFINSQTYVAGKVRTPQKLQIHKNIEIAEKMIKKYGQDKNTY